MSGKFYFKRCDGDFLLGNTYFAFIVDGGRAREIIVKKHFSTFGSKFQRCLRADSSIKTATGASQIRSRGGLH